MSGGERLQVGVIGAGAWGTALAKLAHEAGHRVTLWAYEREVARQIDEQQRNDRYLPGVALPPLTATETIEHAVRGADLLLSVVPSHAVRTVWRDARPALERGDPLVISATKGIEESTLASMVEVLREELPRRLHGGLAALSGPSFAREVAERRPTAVVVAAQHEAVAVRVQHALSTDHLRIYTSEDLVGVELGGAAKNVIAIAVGICDGLDLGLNTRAALITRGLAEITRLAVARGADPLTLAGLSGMGDLVLTCTGGLSRNRGVGLALARGERPVLDGAESGSVAEGIRNARSCYALARRLGVEMPVAETVHAILYQNLSPRDGLKRLMAREPRAERD